MTVSMVGGSTKFPEWQHWYGAAPCKIRFLKQKVVCLDRVKQTAEQHICKDPCHSSCWYRW